MMQKNNLKNNRNFYYPNFKLFLLEELVHTVSVNNCYEVLKIFGEIAFERIIKELQIDEEEFELKIDSQDLYFDISWKI